jgi:intracellular multiplication protein IcmB
MTAVLFVVISLLMAGLFFLTIKTAAVERLLYWMQSFAVGGDAHQLCHLRGPINEYTLTTASGSLVTVFRVVGSRRHVGPEQFEDQIAALCSSLNILMSSGQGGKQHSVSFAFRSDPKGGMEVVKRVLLPSLSTAKRFGASAQFLFDARLKAMAQACVDEVAVLTVFTHPAGMSPAERERWNEFRAKKQMALTKGGVSADQQMTQTPAITPSLMLSRHAAALSLIEDKVGGESSGVQVMIDRLSCHEAVSVMNRFLRADPLANAWRPRLIGDPSPALVGDKKRPELAFPMSIARQVITESLHEIFGNAEIVKRGKHFYATLVMEICPQENPLPRFSDLASAIGRTIPLQCNLEMAPNGLEFNKIEGALISFVGAAGEHNKSVKRAYDELRQLKAAGVPIVALRAVFTTWGDSQDKVVDNLSFLKSSLEGWGNSVVSNETGSPSTAFLSSAPAFSASVPAPSLAGPLNEIARLMPLFRPSSIWGAGQLTLFTREGRPYPIQLGSSAQNFWGTLVFAPTGSGKSFLMNLLNSGVLFSPGALELPMMTIVDKGPSALGMVRLAKAVLPKHLSGQVVYLRPTPTDMRFRVNPFDTQLGCDKPLDADKDFLSALLGGIAPNLGPEGGKLIGLIIGVMYEYFSRLSPSAKRWQWSIDDEISNSLSQIGIEFSEEKPPRVWEIVDALFRVGRIEDAQRVQFHAVPTMSDLTSVLHDKRITDIYGTAPTPTGESMISVLQRNVISASNDYQIFFGTTVHTQEARVTVVDIEGMASAATSEEGRRRFGLMMLFARRLGAKNFFLHEDDVAQVSPAAYLDYHMKRAKRLREQLKFLEYDEIHNARGIPEVQQLLQKDAREGRKYNVVGLLSSQDLADFPEDLVKNSFNFFILGCGNAAAAKELQRTFELSDSEVNVITQECTAPGRLFGMFRTNRGMLSQLLHTKPSPLEIWAFSTSAADTAVRDTLYQRLGVRNTLTFLAEAFPTGSARAFIDQMKMGMSDEADAGGITQMLIRGLEPKIGAFMASSRAVAPEDGE